LPLQRRRRGTERLLDLPEDHMTHSVAYAFLSAFFDPFLETLAHAVLHPFRVALAIPDRLFSDDYLRHCFAFPKVDPLSFPISHVLEQEAIRLRRRGRPWPIKEFRRAEQGFGPLRCDGARPMRFKLEPAV
jgi:hypothetical protein